MKLYCLSGLGVDERAFQNIEVDNVELSHIAWIDPLKNETLEQYAKRLFEETKPEDGYNLLGVSFGGMIAAEFAKIKKPNKLFLVSTISNSSELSLPFKIGMTLRIYKLITSKLIRKSNFITNYLFGVENESDKLLLRQILYDTDPKFLKWAFNAIFNWDNPVKPIGITIHGTKDKIFPIKSDINYKIKNGGHLMVINYAKEISEIIENEMHKLGAQ